MINVSYMKATICIVLCKVYIPRTTPPIYPHTDAIEN